MSNENMVRIKYSSMGDLANEIIERFDAVVKGRGIMRVAEDKLAAVEEFIAFEGKTSGEVEAFVEQHDSVEMLDNESPEYIKKCRAILAESEIELTRQMVKSGGEYIKSYFVENGFGQKATMTIIEHINAEEAEKKRLAEAEASERAAYEAKLAITKQPSASQVEFAKEQLSLLKSRGWNHATNVHEYRSIADDHKEYFELKQWPLDLRGSETRDWNGRI